MSGRLAFLARDIRNRARRALEARHGAAAILLYHRIAAPEADPQQLAVSPAHFAEHLEVIGRHATAVALDELPGLLRRPRPPRGPFVVVTFDDGYRDNLHAAKPLLERHGVPATVFVSSGYVGAGVEFWWDELERLLLGTPNGAAAASATVGGRAFALGTTEERRAAYDVLTRTLKPYSLDDRDLALHALRAWAGEPPHGRPRADRVAVDRNELRRLDGGAVTVGAHTRHHLSLAAHDEATQRAELSAGIDDLGAWLGRPVTATAYPFGTPGTDVSPTTLRLARRSGQRLAVINWPARTTALTSPWALPRYLVRDWAADAFEAWLTHEVLPR